MAGLHEGSSSSISGGLGLVDGYDRDGRVSSACLLRSVLLATDLRTPVERFQYNCFNEFC